MKQFILFLSYNNSLWTMRSKYLYPSWPHAICKAGSGPLSQAVDECHLAVGQLMMHSGTSPAINTLFVPQTKDLDYLQLPKGSSQRAVIWPGPSKALVAWSLRLILHLGELLSTFSIAVLTQGDPLTHGLFLSLMLGIKGLPKVVSIRAHL